MTDKKKRVRDARATRAQILAAAKQEFARHGLGGARIDSIADKSGSNKRMIYHYFASKENLFKSVLEAAYLDIRNAEQTLDLESMPPRDALEKWIRFTWKYYLDNPEFLTLVNSENLHRARHLKDSEAIRVVSRRFVESTQALLDRGVADGSFRSGIDPVQLNITIAAIGYYYLTNQHTGAIVFEMDFVTPEALETRLQFNIDTIMRLVCR